MSKIYDNWEKLVRATLRRNQFLNSAHRDFSDRSLGSCSSFNSSAFLEENENDLREQPLSWDYHTKDALGIDFFGEYGEASRYKLQKIIGKGSSAVVYSAIDTYTGERVAIKRINDVFQHDSGAIRILREIKLLRMLRHPDIVELLRGLKYIHTANVFHWDLMPKNILANADCKLKICDFGLACVLLKPTAENIWTDYVANQWYCAPELCGSFFSRYTPAIDVWSIGCIFAEMLAGKPLFPGKNVVHQLNLMTDLLGTPRPEFIARALADPYFQSLANVNCEPSCQPISEFEFEFERRRLTEDDIRELIYREILEYHPRWLQLYLGGATNGIMYPSGGDLLERRFAHLEINSGEGESSCPLQRQHASLPRERVRSPNDDTTS